MALTLDKPTRTPRHGFVLDRIPTCRGPIWGDSINVYSAKEYASIVDTTFEMARDLAAANGISDDDALRQVLRDEEWTVLPTHREMILERLGLEALTGSDA